MVTDPDGDAWIDAGGNENGDLCLTSFGSSLSGTGVDPRAAWNETVHGGHFFLHEHALPIATDLAYLLDQQAAAVS